MKFHDSTSTGTQHMSVDADAEGSRIVPPVLRRDELKIDHLLLHNQGADQ